MSNNSDRENIQTTILRACEGDAPARKKITSLSTPLIQFQTDKFCRRFCHANFVGARCTLSPPMGGSYDSNRPLCDKANASYAWMLDDLTHEKRLKNVRAESKSQLITYFKTVINSQPFYERWKNWRFNRRVRVPTYISEISEHSSQVYRYLVSGLNASMIAAKVGISEAMSKGLVDKIMIELIARKKLHYLQTNKTVNFSSLSDTDYGNDDESSNFEIADSEFQPERRVYSEQIAEAWAQLSELEQYVIEALVIEQQDATCVLAALSQLNINLKTNQSAKNNNRQQLYYFKRKALEKLSRIIKPDGE